MTTPTPPPVFDADELRRLAEAATPGTWLCCGSSRIAPCPCGLVWSNGPEALHVLTVASETRMSEVPTPNTRQAAANVLFIVAANPAVILALLDERATLLARVEAAEAALTNRSSVSVCADFVGLDASGDDGLLRLELGGSDPGSIGRPFASMLFKRVKITMSEAPSK